MSNQRSLELFSPPSAAQLPWHVLSWGLGVDSSAYLTEILTDPGHHGIDPARMIVVHAVVGSEWSQTYHDAETHILPLLARNKVRTIQVARNGPLQSDGIAVLDDTTTPSQIIRTGPYPLAEESRRTGTAPQVSSRKCSLKFKGWVLDEWLRHNLGTQPYEHVIGYTTEEADRAAKDMVYGTTTRAPVHPLREWGWNRATCLARLFDAFEVVWTKSACVFCPFSGGKSLAVTLQRMREFPEEAVLALRLEFQAMRFNPRSKLFSTHSLRERLEADGNTRPMALIDAELDASPWSVYEVKRIFFPRKHDQAQKGTGWRSVEPLFTGSRAAAEGWLARQARGGVADEDGRLWLRSQADSTVFPKLEHYLVTALAGVEEKRRASFTRRWNDILGTDALPGLAALT